MNPWIDLNLRTKACSKSKYYNNLCASHMTRGAVGNSGQEIYSTENYVFKRRINIL